MKKVIYILILVNGDTKKILKNISAKDFYLPKHISLEIVEVSKAKDKKENCDYVIYLNENDTLSNNYFKFVEEDLNGEQAILPLVLVETEKVKGILNSCIWNFTITTSPGTLTYDLAEKQIDLTLCGALIPAEWYFNDEFHNYDLPIYRDFYFLNSITNKDKKVIGVPKVLLNTKFDFSYPNFSDEEKMSYFKKAKEIKTEEEKEN